MKVAENLELIEKRIEEACRKSGRNRSEITIVAVTKQVSAERAQEAMRAGLIHLGENRDEGLNEKWEVLGDEPIWHFIGSLQTRKVKNIIEKVDYIHSLDRISLAKEIDKRAGQPINCFVQVNTSGEESKHGLDPQEAMDFIKQLDKFKNIHIIGLMTMAPNSTDEKVIRKCFSDLKELQLKAKELDLEYAPCTELSMGMSNDYGIAIEEGATYIRIGTSLVGAAENELEV
ncbi:YggS family pyridoxal phosphate-dependent enzyme [Falsibacillus pallidus]|uniref:YggS family pyridoxal phosphate-dependent enzyme n=1 Tax=Falsibacillus pallidus TaxID=493781 RepID=UPI003D97D5BE